jgi:hypothetical protein
MYPEATPTQAPDSPFTALPTPTSSFPTSGKPGELVVGPNWRSGVQANQLLWYKPNHGRAELEVFLGVYDVRPCRT